MMAVEERRQAAWLEEARQKAWADFKRLPPPAKTVETWRRVDFNQWRTNLLTDETIKNLQGAVIPVEVEKAGLLRHSREGGNPYMDPRFRGGDGLKNAGVTRPDGVIVTSLEDAAQQHSKLVEPYLKNLSVSLDFRTFEAANLALFRSGHFVYVPKGVRVDKPIELVCSQHPQTDFFFPRVLIIVEEGAEVTIVESHLGEGAGAPEGVGAPRDVRAPHDAQKRVSIAFSRLVIGANAKVRYFYDQSLSTDTVHFWHQQADLGAGSLLEHDSALLGSTIHKSELDVRLTGPGARSAIKGILLGTKNQQFDPHTVQWHQSPKTSSDLLFRMALKDRARSVYTGFIRIEKEAAACDAFQQNNNLLLSNDARADSTPVLEILTNNVHCKHGATVGPVNPDELFYLCSRGLPPEEAARILVLGFFDPILSKLPLEHQKERILARIEERLK